MEDRDKAVLRLRELLATEPDSIPFIVGYLTWQMDGEQIAKAVDAYLEHDEAIEAIRTASRLAREAFRSPEQP